jgi:DNA ligase (NAD+)
MNKIKELEKSILYHRAKYYSGESEISDEAFDLIEEELRILDPENEILNSLGSTSKSLNQKIPHARAMLSLDKTYDYDELIKWVKLEETISMLKYDGTACSLIYENKKFLLAKTRGDGFEGENITSKVVQVPSIPKLITCKKNNNQINDIDFKNVEIRGELYIDKAGFANLKDEMISKFLPL